MYFQTHLNVDLTKEQIQERKKNDECQNIYIF